MILSGTPVGIYTNLNSQENGKKIKEWASVSSNID